MAKFVPLGIPAFKGKSEEGKIKFTLNIELDDADKMLVQIRNGAESIYEEEITDPKMLTQGSHDWYWDGFDENEILDTAFLTKAHLNLLMRVWKDDETEFSTIDFNAEYDQVNWVDVKINKKEKRIDVTLRVNLKDGGEYGTQKDCNEMGRTRRAPIILDCPWDKIPKEALSYYGKSPIKKRTKSFEDLERLALEGLNYHWGRNRDHFIAKDVTINDEKYEVFVNAVNTTENTMDDVDLIFNTNNPWLRSMNPGSVDGIISFFGQVMPERIVYNYGYMKGDNMWYWLGNKEADVNDDFSYTSAHEIGHEILKSFSKKSFHSYKHKGSSTLSDAKPIDNGGVSYPKSGEIDLMKYYNDDPYWYDFERIAAHEDDVLGLIWLTKMELK
ncbi:MAG: hypothetical protein CSA40_00650 [Flavobacteriales bacterium]|nr:MAG: hypothetical protein CSA40_00650 [Flavobacteriales bacterium]